MDRGAWLVRWRDGSGRQRGKRFSSEEAAQAFDSALSEITPGERQADATGRAGGGRVGLWPLHRPFLPPRCDAAKSHHRGATGSTGAAGPTGSNLFDEGRSQRSWASVLRIFYARTAPVECGLSDRNGEHSIDGRSLRVIAPPAGPRCEPTRRCDTGG